MTTTGEADWTLLWIGIAAYVASLAVAIALRVGRAPSPLGALTRLHFFCTPLYLVPALLLPGARPSDIAVGLFVYFMLHYALVVQIFGQALRGFSIGLCLAAWRLGASKDRAVPAAQIAASYGGG